MLNLKDYIRNIPNFPKPGIIFRDITTALKKPEAFRQIIDEIYFNFKNENIDYIAAIESAATSSELLWHTNLVPVWLLYANRENSLPKSNESNMSLNTEPILLKFIRTPLNREKGFWLSTICLLPEEQFAQPANLSKK